MYLYSINLDLHSSNYHIQVIDVRSYNKDSYHTTSHQPSTLSVGAQLVPPTPANLHILVPIIWYPSQGSVVNHIFLLVV